MKKKMAIVVMALITLFLYTWGVAHIAYWTGMEDAAQTEG